MPVRIIVLALLALSLALPAAADEVHLTNGESFEGVIARVEGDRVSIRMPHGVIRLPLSRVARVERSSSPFEEYLVRSQALTGGTDAEAWLELARWARARDLRSGMRDAALEAARLDPQLEGLEPLLEELGYAFDHEGGRWIPYPDLMARRGFMEVDDRWVPAEVVAETARRVREEHERRLAERRAAQVDRAITLLALAQLQETREERERPPVVVGSPYGVSTAAPVAVLPGAFVPRARHPGDHPGRHGHPGRGEGGGSEASRGQGGASRTVTWSDVARHQPGSIIPLRPAITTSAHHED